jgi:hypothetical protein
VKHLVIPDLQLRPGDDFKFLTAIGNYIVAKKPEVIICIGDAADMPSLSSYDQGKKSFEGRRYRLDVEAAVEGMATLLAPLQNYNKKAKKGHRERYTPRMIMTLGNHEARITRAVNDDPKLDGVLSIDDLKYKEFGWEVHDFLEVVVIDNIAYSHYFVTGVAGRPASTATAQLRKTNMSSISGHQQGRQVAYATKADGSRIASIIAGSCYESTHDYLGPQGNKHWNGVVMLNEVDDGNFDEMFVSLNYLKQNYL